MIETSNIMSKLFQIQGLPGVAGGTGSLGESGAAGGPRFDALLSEVSKTMSAATGKDEMKLNEKLSAALSAVMANLIQLPPSQIRQLSADVNARSAWVEGFKAVQDLAPQEKASLKQLAGIAVSRFVNVSPPPTTRVQPPGAPETAALSRAGTAAGEQVEPVPKADPPRQAGLQAPTRAATENPGPQGWIPGKETESSGVTAKEIVVTRPSAQLPAAQAPLPSPAQAGSTPVRVATLFSRPAVTPVGGQQVAVPSRDGNVRSAAPAFQGKPAVAGFEAVRNASAPVTISTRSQGFEPESGKAPSLFVGQALKQEGASPRNEAAASPQDRPVAPSQGAARTAPAASVVRQEDVRGASVVPSVPAQAAGQGQTQSEVVDRPSLPGIRSSAGSRPEIQEKPEVNPSKEEVSKQAEVQKPAPQAKGVEPKPAVKASAPAEIEGLPEMMVMEEVAAPEALPGTEIFEVKPGADARPASGIPPQAGAKVVPENVVFELPVQENLPAEVVPQGKVSVPAPLPVQAATPLQAPVQSVVPTNAPASVTAPAPAVAAAEAPEFVGSGKSSVPASVSEPAPVQARDLKSLKESKGELKPLATDETNGAAPLAFQGDLQRLKDGVVREFVLKESVLKQVAAQIEGAGKEASLLHIRLKPESLGSLDVTLRSEGGKLAAKIFAGNLEVRDVIANNLAAFKQTLEDQGLKVNELSVAVRSDVGQDSGQGRRQETVWQAPAVRKDPVVPAQPFVLAPGVAFGYPWNSDPGQLSLLA